jgi:hypothetical protein
MYKTIRNSVRLAFLGLLIVVLSASAAHAQKGGGGGGKGGGGGGSGGGSVPTPLNPFLGEWIGGPYTTNIVDQLWDFTFKKDYTFTLVVLDRYTGVSVSYAGTYDFSLHAPDSFPLLTMVSKGELLLQMEFFFYDGALILQRGTNPFMEFEKKPDAN